MSALEAPRIALKFYASDPEEAAEADFVGLFHQWIRDRIGHDVLIDVADYRHVRDGPGVMLLGHRGEYALDRRDGRIGLSYRTKRFAAVAPQDNLRHAMATLVEAAQRAEADRDVVVDTDEVLVRIEDRAYADNSGAAFADVQDGLHRFFGEMYGGPVTLEHVEDPKGPLTVRVRSNVAPELDELGARLSD